MKRLVLPSLVLALTLPAGMACVLFTLALQIPSLGLLGEPHRTSGTVVGINNFKESGTTYQSRQVQFTSENGQQISIDFYGCWPFDCFPDYSIGSNAPVIYPTNHPELAIADTLSGRLLTPLFMLLIGLASTLAGLLYTAGAIRKRPKGQ